VTVQTSTAKPVVASTSGASVTALSSKPAAIGKSCVLKIMQFVKRTRDVIVH
jgi:hypothetical protein